jgi:hypothetical protein
MAITGFAVSSSLLHHRMWLIETEVERGSGRCKRIPRESMPGRRTQQRGVAVQIFDRNRTDDQSRRSVRASAFHPPACTLIAPWSSEMPIVPDSTPWGSERSDATQHSVRFPLATMQLV